MASGFVHLHVHSDFSFMGGVASPADLAAAAARAQMGALALTDHQGLSGVVRFYQACQEVGVKPIIGCEVVVEAAGINGSEADLPPEMRLELPPPIGQARAQARGFHLTLLAKDFDGYRALCELLSRAHLRAGFTAAGSGKAASRRDPSGWAAAADQERSIVTLGDLRAHAGHLIGLSGCPRSEASLAISRGAYGRAQTALGNLAACFTPGDFYVELVNPLTRGAQRTVARLAEAASLLNLPTVATNNIHYVTSDQRRLRDVVAAAGALTSLPGPDPDPNAERYLKSAAEMRTLFAAYPTACDATLEIAARCTVEFPQGEYHFPAADLAPGETADWVLAERSWAGLSRRYPVGSPNRGAAEARLRHELSVIAEMGFSDYFLIVKDIVDAARERGIRCTGRGSAGNSIVSYALDISDADPVLYDLLFERFLNRARRKMPDIDIDFDSARRDEVIDYIYRRFGHDHVAMVATVQTTSARGAIRIAGRAFGYDLADINALTRGVPWVGAGRLREALATYPECRDHALGEESNRQMVQVASELGHLATHLGTHLGGFIITSEPVATWTPLQYAAKGTVVSQHDKDDVEFLGLVKMDILGLRTHSAVSEAVELIRAGEGGAAGAGEGSKRLRRPSGSADAVDPPAPAECFSPSPAPATQPDPARTSGSPETAIARGVDPFNLPHDDPEVYDMIGRGETVGVFQLESSGQRSLSRRLKPTRFDDIIAQISLFRPGPLKANMITPFIRRRHGIEKVTVVHPAMREVLADTYGIIVYQEQVLRLGREVAGMSLDEADLLRRAMTSRTTPQQLAELEESFVGGAVSQGVERGVAVEIFRQLKGFAAYGFNKAHAANFAVVSYATAHLRRYHPAELACAILNHEPMGFYSPRAVLNDARRNGVGVLPIHVNESGWNCAIERASVDLEAEGAGRGVEPHSTGAEEPTASAQDGGRRSRGETPHPAPTAAIRVGFAYCNGMSHREAAAIERARREWPFRSADDLKERASLTGRVLEMLVRIGALEGLELGGYAHLAPLTPSTRIAAELSLLGLSVTAHPLELCIPDLLARDVTFAIDLPSLRNRAKVRVVGLRERAQTPPTKSGKRTCFLTLEDATGLLDVVVFSDALEGNAKTIAHGKCFLVEGTVQNTPEHGLAIVADHVEHYTIRDHLGSRMVLGRSTRTDAPGATFGRVAPDVA